MDRAIKIPGTNITVGLDALIGLVPIGGDVLTGLIQVGIVLVALTHYRVPKVVATRMAANVLLDTAVGAIPLLGDVFDVAFKANTRNLKLLKEVHERQVKGEPVEKRSSYAYLALLAVAMLSLIAMVAIGFITALGWALKRPLF